MRLREFKRAGHWPTLACAFVYFDTSFMVWTLMGALGIFIAQIFHLTPGQKGLLVAIPLLAAAVLRFVLGIATDHFGPRKTGLAALTLTLVPLLWGWLHAISESDLVIIGLMLGVPGASFAVALPLASRWYPPQFQGLALGIAGAGNSGTVVGALLAPRLAEVYGWRTVFGLAALPVTLVFLLFWLFAKESPNCPPAKSLKNYLKLLREPDTWWFNGFYMVTSGGFVGLASFLPIFFFDQYGVTRVQAGSFAAACVFAGSLLRPFGGWLADWFGGIRVLSFLFCGIAALLFGLSTLPTLPTAIALLFLTMACLGTGNGSVFQLVPQRFAQEIGVATGVVGAAGGLGGFFLPTMLGWLRGLEGNYALGLLAFSLVAAGAAIALSRVKHSWRAEWARPDLNVAF